MRLGQKKIFHLEAWVVKVMSLIKVCLWGLCLPCAPPMVGQALTDWLGDVCRRRASLTTFQLTIMNKCNASWAMKNANAH